MDIKLIITFILINLTFAGILGTNVYFYTQSSKAKFQGIVKTKKENIDHLIEDYFKDYDLSFGVVTQILKDSLEITKDNVDKDLKHKDKNKSFVRLNPYRYVVSYKIKDEENEDHRGDYHLIFGKTLVSIYNKDNLCDQREFLNDWIKTAPDQIFGNSSRSLTKQNKFGIENKAGIFKTSDYYGYTVEFNKL